LIRISALSRGLLLASLALWLGCTAQSSFKTVEFRAPSRPNPVLRPLLEDVDRIGILCITNIEPFRQLDIEKVMARLADGVARGLSNMRGTTVVSQDEIIWHFKGTVLDSGRVYSEDMRTALREEMELDAMVYVELNGLQTRMMPVSPSPYSGALGPNPAMDMNVELQLSLVNLHTGKVWRRSGQQRNFQPIQLQLFGGGADQAERQLLTTVVTSVRRFLFLVSPPPRIQRREFEISAE
jgi:hypothetical protein